MGTPAYDKANTTRVNLKLNNKTDEDIIRQLRKVDSIQGYIKSLIRADMQKGAKTMTYHIKPDYLSEWGSDATEDTIITEDELNRLAREWETPVEDLLDQLVPDETIWYAVQRNPDDDWSAGSYSLKAAKEMARKWRDDPDYHADDPLIAVIVNDTCVDEIRDFD